MASNKGELPKTLLVTLFCEDREEISINSEKWVIDDDEILYPTLVKGAKREKFIRCHQEPDPETWTKYPYSLLKICCEYIFIYSKPVKVFMQLVLTSSCSPLFHRFLNSHCSATLCHSSKAWWAHYNCTLVLIIYHAAA